MQSIESALYRVARWGVVAGILGFPAFLSAQQPRFPQLQLEDTSGDQRTMADRMIKETRVGLGGPWNVMLRSPTVAQGMMDLYNYFRWKSALPARLVEFGILITSREWSVPYEWYIHYPLAIKEGVAAATLAEVRAGKRPAAATAEEAAAYDMAVELLRNHVVSQPTFQKAKAVLGEKAVVDLTALVGTYVAIGGLLNVSEVGGPDKEGPEFLPKPRGWQVSNPYVTGSRPPAARFGLITGYTNRSPMRSAILCFVLVYACSLSAQPSPAPPPDESKELPPARPDSKAPAPPSDSQDATLGQAAARRNENVHVNLIDNDATKEALPRKPTSDSATAQPSFPSR